MLLRAVTGPWRRLGAPSIALLAAALTGLILAISQPVWLAGLQERATDGAWRLLAQSKDERRLILIDIDERSLREVGPWPWPRDVQARLLDRLAQEGVSQQVLDIVFADPRPEDASLLRAIADHKPVLAQVFALPGQGDRIRTGQPAGALAGQSCPPAFEVATGHVANHAEIALTSAGLGGSIGHITPRLSTDGVIRAQPALLCFEGKLYPALALAALMRASGETSLQIQAGGWLGSRWTIQGSQGRLGAIPVGAGGDLRLPWWRAPDSWVGLSASDVLAGRVPGGLLQGAWVLVGGTAFGLNDSIATPFAAGSPGVQAHAQLITALLDGRVPFTPRAAPVLQCVLALGGLLLLAWLVGLVRTPAQWRYRLRWLAPRVSLPWLPVLGVLWGLTLLALHMAALAAWGWWVGWAEPAMAVMVGALAWGMAEHALSRLERDRLFGHLASYLPAPVAAALASQGPSGSVSARMCQVSVLFADIRNFSAYCEARPPEESAAVLHAFYSMASRVVQAEGGVIEAFEGDAVMAVWGADGSVGQGLGADHARRALNAAVQMYTAMQSVLPDPAPGGVEPLALGIGLESGPAMEGSLGLASRRAHIVMGRTVTIANRLVGMTTDLGFPILVGEGMASQAGGAGLQSLGTFMLEGMRVTHHIYAYGLFPPPRLDLGNASGSVAFSASEGADVDAPSLHGALQQVSPAPPHDPSRGRYTH